MPDSTLHFFSSALAIREKQISLSAANIANRDTPNYKAQDIDFASVFQDAIKAGPNSTRPLQDKIMFRQGTTAKLDGNTVDATIEASKFSEYTQQYQMALEMLTSTRDSRLKAIRGK
ncbi:flagellar basal body rod protein FlgB [Photobacterium leiognathi]|uniref:flagellar basal body rod protein FlgB n=1 Tax=Photobacterium leiognathi TaxID=553611 RepID=UPI001EE08111|nr:flagellar basal body rod protein FlgB [Photobacterium leiognathi]MCG3883687.1 flagellar basal body rod protein FlgB [Photobacterium leiognathi]